MKRHGYPRRNKPAAKDLQGVPKSLFKINMQRGRKPRPKKRQLKVKGKFVSSSHRTLSNKVGLGKHSSLLVLLRVHVSPRAGGVGMIHWGARLLANLPDTSIYYSSICEEHYMLLNALIQNISLLRSLACRLLLLQRRQADVSAMRIGQNSQSDSSLCHG